MKKRVILVIAACIIAFLFLVAVGRHISSPALQMKTLALSQRLIPIFYVHPKDRIVAYVDNADDLFALSGQFLISNPVIALDSAFRAENGMTLAVAELRRLPDTSTIPYSLLFDTFARQYSFLSGIPKNTPDITQFETIKTFTLRNENTAKTIYYSKLPPQKPVRL